MSYRTAIADVPRDALLVVGAREAALARRVVCARRVGFRLGATGLACLVTASVAILFDL